MSFEYNTTGIAKDTLQGSRLAAALSLSVPELTAIANGGPARHGVDSFTAVLALNVKGPAEKAARAQQAGQQPKPPTVKDQVVAAAQPAPTDAGIGSLNAGNVMTEQGMAAGGIVAFDEGGEVPHFDGTAGSLVGSPFSRSPFGRQLSEGAETGAAYEERQKLINAITELYGPKASFAGFFTPQSDTERQQAKDIMGRLSSMSTDELRKIASSVPNAPAAPAPQASMDVPHPSGYAGLNASVSDIPSAPAPAPALPREGPSEYKPQTSFPAVDKAMKNLRTAYGQYDTFDPMQQLASFDASQYAQFLPKTAEDISNQRADAEAELRKLYPESREAAEALMSKRYAGLEDMFKKREARGEEELKEAEKEKAQTAGLGVMQLASELVTKPLTKIDTSAAFQTFKDANKTYSQARKDFNAAKDKIDESRELQKIGQSEKADALYREGVKGIFDFKNQTAQLENAQDAAYKSGLFSIADKSVQAQATKLSKKVDLGKAEVETALGLAGIQSAENRAAIAANAEVKKYQMLAPGREAKTNDMIRDSAQSKYQNWLKTEGKLAALKPNVAEAKRLQFLREEYLANGYTPEEIAKRLGAPSGGGADRQSLFQVEKL